MSIPRIFNYTDKANTTAVELPNNKTIYYSYTTAIAFRSSKGLFISKNEFSPTTGKHINMINRDQSIRIPHDELIAIIECECE